MHPNFEIPIASVRLSGPMCLSEWLQRGPATFYLRAILRKRDNSRATSNKIMYKTTDSQHLKLKNGRYVSGSLKFLHNSK